MTIPKSMKVVISLLLVGVGAGLVFMTWLSPGPEELPDLRLASAGSVAITNSLKGEAVLSATNLAPGDKTTGSVRIGNSGDIPMRLRLSTKVARSGGLNSSLKLQLVGQGGKKLFQGSPAKLRRWLGIIQPDQHRRFRFIAALPANARNSLQGKSTSVDLLWQGKPAAPPEECKIRALRSRLFVFKRRHRFRMVVRYRSIAPALIRLVFYERLPGDRRGARVGGFKAQTQTSEKEWTLKRIVRRRSTKVLNRLRRSRRGFIVRVNVSGAPDYCARRMNLVLTELRRVDRQFVWFQRGSFRRID